jgi:hypothetical protein
MAEKKVLALPANTAKFLGTEKRIFSIPDEDESLIPTMLGCLASSRIRLSERSSPPGKLRSSVEQAGFGYRGGYVTKITGQRRVIHGAFEIRRGKQGNKIRASLFREKGKLYGFAGGFINAARHNRLIRRLVGNNTFQDLLFFRNYSADLPNFVYLSNKPRFCCIKIQNMVFFNLFIHNCGGD